jgi:hypothetical protein
MFSATGRRMAVHYGPIHPESFLRTYMDLKEYLLSAPKEYAGGFFNFRKFFSELIDIRRRYLYYRWAHPQGERLFWPTAPNASFIFDSIAEKYHGYVQWWFHTPLRFFANSDHHKFLNSVIHGQHFYSGFINPGSYIDAYFAFEPKDPKQVKGDAYFAFSFPIEEGAVFDLAVRYGDMENDFVMCPVFEAMDYLDQERGKFDGVVVSNFGDVISPDSGLDLLGDKKLLLAYAASFFLEAFQFTEFEGKKFVCVRKERAFFSLFDSFQYFAGRETTWRWPEKAPKRSVPKI